MSLVRQAKPVVVSAMHGIIVTTPCYCCAITTYKSYCGTSHLQSIAPASQDRHDAFRFSPRHRGPFAASRSLSGRARDKRAYPVLKRFSCFSPSCLRLGQMTSCVGAPVVTLLQIQRRRFQCLLSPHENIERQSICCL